MRRSQETKRKKLDTTNGVGGNDFRMKSRVGVKSGGKSFRQKSSSLLLPLPSLTRQAPSIEDEHDIANFWSNKPPLFIVGRSSNTFNVSYNNPLTFFHTLAVVLVGIILIYGLIYRLYQVIVEPHLVRDWTGILRSPYFKTKVVDLSKPEPECHSNPTYKKYSPSDSDYLKKHAEIINTYPIIRRSLSSNNYLLRGGGRSQFNIQLPSLFRQVT